jgi:hypothetical protein
MSFRLPEALQTRDDRNALRYLTKYYQKHPEAPVGTDYTGARFDDWDSTGTRAADANRFTSDDLVAITFLSVTVPRETAWELLKGRPDDFNALLLQMPDQDLVEINPDDICPEWPPWRLWGRLRELRGVEWVIASKLLARKRPRLIPLYDRVVKNVVGGDLRFWVPLCQALRENDLNSRLVRLRDEADLPPSISGLRVFDVIAWMEGKESTTERQGRPELL